jgi:hypothetical protein
MESGIETDLVETYMKCSGLIVKNNIEKIIFSLVTMDAFYT